MWFVLSGELVNVLVTLSNIIGVIGIFYCSGLKQLVLILSVVGSILMHLSEQKHGLPGIYPFNVYSKELLWLDRIGAYIAAIYALFFIANVTGTILIMICFAALCIFIAEVVISTQWIYYIIFHSIWHFLVYSIFLTLA